MDALLQCKEQQLRGRVYKRLLICVFERPRNEWVYDIYSMVYFTTLSARRSFTKTKLG